MAKQQEDAVTLELPLPTKRGRPLKPGGAMTDAERARAYRARKREERYDLWNKIYAGRNATA